MARRAGGIKIDISANVARLSADMAQAVGVLGGFEKAANNIGRSLKAALGGAIFVTAALGVKKLSDSILDLAEVGDKAGDIQNAFEALGGKSSALEAASRSTQGLIDKFTLMQAANAGLIKQIPNLNENLSALADLAVRVAGAKDLDPAETFKNLIDAVASGKAQALKEFGFNIGEVKSKAEGTQVALSQLNSVLDKFDPVTLGAADSVSVFRNALSDAQKYMAIGVDSSDALVKQLQRLTLETNPDEMIRFGKAIGDLESVFVGLASNALPVAVKLIGEFASTLDGIYGISNQGKKTKLLTEIEDVQSQIDNIRNPFALGSGGTLWNLWDPDSMGPRQTKTLEALKKKQFELARELGKLFLDEYNTPKSKAVTNNGNPPIIETVKKGGIDKVGAELSRMLRDNLKDTGDIIRQQLESAIQNVDPASFNAFKNDLQKNIEEAYRLAHEKEIKSGLVTEQEIGQAARAEGERTVAEYESRMMEAQGRLGEQLRQQHEQAVQSWVGFYDQIFNPENFDLEQSLKQLATGFLAEITAGITGGFAQDANNFIGLGQLIAKGFNDSVILSPGTQSPGQVSGAQTSGAGWSGALGSILGMIPGLGPDFAGAGGSASAANSAGIQGPAMEDGSFGGSAGAAQYLGPAIQVIGSAASARQIDKQTNSNQGTGGAVGSGVGATVGAIFGGPAGAMLGANIGNLFGSLVGSLFKWGSTDPQTNARHAFANFIEEGFKKLSRVTFFDGQGKAQLYNSQLLNFVEGDRSRFNPGGDIGGTNWTDNFNAMGSDVVSAFSGIGQAMEEMLGLTEDVGAQLGYILATNLSGNIDNARLLVQQLGLSLEDMTDALVEAGRTGEMTWLEVESALQGVNQAFGEGLVAVGDVGGAFEELVGSGGRGIAALKSIKDLAVETLEAKGRTLEDLRAKLIAAGKSPEVVNALMEAIKNRGITSLEGLRDANDRVIGGIVADTNSGSQQLANSWAQMEDKVKNLKETLDGIESSMEKNLTINVKTNFDGNTEKAIDQNIFKGTPTEKLPTVDMKSPTTKAASYRRTVSNPSDVQRQGAVTVNVDARGADRGVHSEVVRAMSVMENRIMTRTADLVYQQIQRG